jgi:hypothetical protein
LEQLFRYEKKLAELAMSGLDGFHLCLPTPTEAEAARQALLLEQLHAGMGFTLSLTFEGQLPLPGWDWRGLGVRYVTLDWEGTGLPEANVWELANQGVGVGLVLGQTQPVESMFPWLPRLHHCLLRSGMGQPYQGRDCAQTQRRVAALRAELTHRPLPHPQLWLQGGIDLQTVVGMADAGADVLMPDVALFRAVAPALTLQAMHTLLETTRDEKAGRA